MAPPDSLHFQLIYDVRRTFPGRWEVLILAIPVFVVGYWAYRHRRGGTSLEHLRPTVIGLLLMFCAGFGMVFVVTVSLLSDVALRIHLSRGTYEVLQGVVTDFRPGHGGTRTETWTLVTPTGARKYRYSSHLLSGGYDGDADRGWMLGDGVHVRVFDVDGQIARLEVAF